MSQDLISLELMEELIPKDEHVCPKCKKPRLICGKDFSVSCPRCNIVLRPGKNKQRSSAYFDLIAKALLKEMKSTGFFSQLYLEQGARLLENQLQKNRRHGDTGRHFKLLALCELILAGLERENIHKELVFDHLQKVQEYLEQARKTGPYLSWKAEVLLLDVQAWASQGPSLDQIDKTILLYKKALEKAGKLLKNASKSSRSRKKALLALQYLYLGFYFRGLEGLGLNEKLQEQNLDFLAINPDLAGGPARACFDQMLSLVSRMLDGRIEDLHEPDLIEYMLEVGLCYKAWNEPELAEKLLEASSRAARKQWEKKKDLQALKTLTANQLFFFQEALRKADSPDSDKEADKAENQSKFENQNESENQNEAESQSEPEKQAEKTGSQKPSQKEPPLSIALQNLDQWLHAWSFAEGRVFLANDSGAWLSYQMQMRQILAALEDRELYNVLDPFLRENVRLLESLPERDNTFFIRYFAAYLAEKTALAIARKRKTPLAKKAKNIYLYAEKAVKIWQELAQIDPFLLAQCARDLEGMSGLVRIFDLIDEKVRDRTKEKKLISAMDRVVERVTKAMREENLNFTYDLDFDAYFDQTAGLDPEEDLLEEYDQAMPDSWPWFE